MLIVFAGIQDSLEFERVNNNLKKEDQQLGSYLFFSCGRFALFHKSALL
jgi:hypothetical protein